MPSTDHPLRQLHHAPSTAAMAPHILLEEIGAPFELVPVDPAQQGHKSPEYLRLNPNGLIPVLVEGDLVLYETAAICLHLADHAPAARLVAPLGSIARSHTYKWLAWMTNTLQATLILYFYPQRWMDEGNAQGAAELQRHAERRVAALLQQLDDELARHGGPWFLGADHSLLDAYCLTLCRWTRNFAHSRPARDYPHLGPYLRRVLARPAVQRVFATEGLAQPFV